MKILFVGGTGVISTSCVRLAIERGHEVCVLNRGTRKMTIPGATVLTADIHDQAAAARAIGDAYFDTVANFVAFGPADIERDIELFAGRTNQYIFVSSASAYQKPPRCPIITESTPLVNPFWEYSRGKIACEERLTRALREQGFPMTIVRPSLTYSDFSIPLAIGCWTDYTVVDRMKEGRPVIVHGDGSSLWTFTHADDFAKGFVGLCGHPQVIGEAFHITADELLSWDQAYQIVAEAAGATANIVHIPSDFIARLDESHKGSLLGDKAVSAIFDNSKIKRFVPDFKATIPFHIGIRRTLAWFHADASRMRIDEGNNRLIDRVIAAYQKALA